MMVSKQVRCLILSSFLLLPAATGEIEEDIALRNAILQKEAGRFPVVAMSKDDMDESKLHLNAPPKNALRIDDNYYHGFRFRTPEWLDGPIDWMFVRMKGAPYETGQFMWFIAPAEGTQSSKFTSLNYADIDNYPRLLALYPNGKRVYTQTIPQETLEPGKEYIIAYRLHRPDLHTLAIGLTVRSDRGKSQFGLLPLTARPQKNLRKAEEIMAEAMAARREHGKERFFRLLDAEFALRAMLDREFRKLYSEVWREAQVRSGRDSVEWAAELNDWMFSTCVRHRYFQEALEIVGNDVASLQSARRHGRSTEVLEWWSEANRRGGYILNPSAYKDLGPGIQLLPEVRKREIPFLTPFSQVDFGNNPPASLPDSFKIWHAVVFGSLADQAMRAGRWKEGLEWRLWLVDWAKSKCESKIDNGFVNLWEKSTAGVADGLQQLGFDESSLEWYDALISNSMPETYRGRSKLTAGLQMLSIRLKLGTAGPDAVNEAADLAARIRGNLYLHEPAWWAADLVHARALLGANRENEGMDLIGGLLAKGYEQARWVRVKHWIATGRKGGVEEELLQVLQSTREAGNKIDEPAIYSLYADFLEKEGRLAEAVRMRREAVRLNRGFDLIVAMPAELAKLALLLERLGDSLATKATADAAATLVAGGRLPARVADEVGRLLSGLTGRDTATREKSPSKPRVDLQPMRAVVIPVEGMAVETLLTLANPSDQVAEGSLTSAGTRLLLSYSPDGREILARLGPDGGDGKASLPTRIEAGSYVLIRVMGEAPPGSAAGLTLSWSSPGSGKGVGADVTFEKADSGVTSGVLEAGQFRLNAFYGIPIHHHYVSSRGEEMSPPMRFVSSVPTRVELYAADDTPLCVDAQGNGSLLDAGDEIFSTGHGNGNVAMPLSSSQAGFRLQVYPLKALPMEGFSLRTEVFTAGAWTVYAEDRIIP